MTKTEKLNFLFNSWEEEISSYKGKFVKDGIINEELFETSKPKILMITKEPNDPEQTAGDFRDWWKNGGHNSFDYRISEWSYGILNDFPVFDTIWNDKQSGYQKASNALKCIAFMNIKKVGGKSGSNYAEMLTHLKQNLHFIREQISIICPDIIITGLTWREHADILFANPNWQSSGYNVSICKIKNCKVIEFYHPSSRIVPAASYSLLENVVKSKSFKELLDT